MVNNYQEYGDGPQAVKPGQHKRAVSLMGTDRGWKKLLHDVLLLRGDERVKKNTVY